MSTHLLKKRAGNQRVQTNAGFFAAMDMPASSALMQQRLGWRLTQMAGIIDDLDHMNLSSS
jgi:hypothetical protein